MKYNFFTTTYDTPSSSVPSYLPCTVYTVGHAACFEPPFFLHIYTNHKEVDDLNSTHKTTLHKC